MCDAEQLLRCNDHWLCARRGLDVIGWKREMHEGVPIRTPLNIQTPRNTWTPPRNPDTNEHPNTTEHIYPQLHKFSNYSNHQKLIAHQQFTLFEYKQAYKQAIRDGSTDGAVYRNGRVRKDHFHATVELPFALQEAGSIRYKLGPSSAEDSVWCQH